MGTLLDVCAGIGGFSLAFKHLIGGWHTVGYVEIDRYCREVLRSRIRDGILDDAPIFHDLREFSGERYRGKVDLVTAGFPCQPFSIAGKQRGESDERNLWPDVWRAICEVRPRIILLENVPNLLANKYIGRIFGDLAKSGYDLRWDCLSAGAIGAHFASPRVKIVAHDATTSCGRWEGRSQRPIQTSIWSTKEFERLVLRVSQLSISAGARGRISDGLPNRIQRLRTLGNAVVPAVVAKAWEVLNDPQE